MKAAAALLCLGSLLSPASLISQTRIGFHGGFSITTFGGADAYDPASSHGAEGGGFIRFALGRVVAVRTGASFVEKGAEQRVTLYPPSGLPVDATLRWAMSYLEIPFLTQLSIPSSGRFGAYTLIGPVFSVTALCNVEFESQLVDDSVACSSPALQGGFDVTSTDWGVLVGGGVEFGKGAGASAFGEITYDIGMPTFDHTVNGYDVRHRALAISFGVTFALRQ